ncbi:MAG: arginine--tRNA ligase [Candidatus Paceibacterota bacterium]
MQEQIKNLIKDALKSLNIGDIDFGLEHPEDLKNGDYSTNVAMVLAKNLKTNPKELAEKIKSEIEKILPKEIQKIEAVGGFINFYLSREFFANSIKKISTDKEFGKNNSLVGQKILVEHTDPNPFKEFHIGHLMPNVIGSAIARILDFNGGEVKQACYQGDVGMHVAKSIWAMQKGVDISGAYVAGALALNEDEVAKGEIQEINKKIYDKSDKEINKIYNAGRKKSLEYFDSVYKKLGTNFDYFFFESEVANIGKEIVEKNIGKVFEKGEGGAIVFKAENFDKTLHTRVFINSEGLSTYEAKELGLAQVKYEKYKYDKSVIITGNEINEYFKVLLCAMKQIFPELAEKTTHLSHGMLRLPSGKMSSRTGDVVTAESLIEMVKVKVKNEEIVAIGAIKYMILRSSIGGDIIFDIETSVSTEGDSGVYLQYSHARASSILTKAKKENISPDLETIPEETFEVEKLLYRFPEVVLRSASEYQPHHITTYLTELARAYNSFYANEIIVKKEDPTSPYKVAVTFAFTLVMKQGLHLLGIEAPEKM